MILLKEQNSGPQKILTIVVLSSSLRNESQQCPKTAAGWLNFGVSDQLTKLQNILTKLSTGELGDRAQ